MIVEFITCGTLLALFVLLTVKHIKYLTQLRLVVNTVEVPEALPDSIINSTVNIAKVEVNLWKFVTLPLLISFGALISYLIFNIFTSNNIEDFLLISVGMSGILTYLSTRNTHPQWLVSWIDMKNSVRSAQILDILQSRLEELSNALIDMTSGSTVSTEEDIVEMKREILYLISAIEQHINK